MLLHMLAGLLQNCYGVVFRHMLAGSAQPFEKHESNLRYVFRTLDQEREAFPLVNRDNFVMNNQ